MAKALDNEMINYFTQLNDAEKKSERITIEQYNQELDEAEAEFEKGEVVTHDELLKQIRKW